MSWYESVFEVIEMRSFSNLWYWIGLAVLWSSASHWVLGIPYDSILRARRRSPDSALQDLHDLTRVNVNRILLVVETSGSLIALLGSTIVTALGIIGFYYQIEFAQAVFLLLFPVVLIGALSVRTAQKIAAKGLQEDELVKTLLMTRFFTQLIGVVSIFVTAMYGMFVNLYTGPY